MKHFFVTMVALSACVAICSQSQAIERGGQRKGNGSGKSCYATLQWDGRCDPTPYLQPTFRDYAQPRQLGANAYMYWRCPQCAEDQYGYGTPGFNFFTVPGTFDPSLGLGGGAGCIEPDVNYESR